MSSIADEVFRWVAGGSAANVPDTPLAVVIGNNYAGDGRFLLESPICLSEFVAMASYRDLPLRVRNG